MPNNLIPTPIGLPAIVNKLQVALYEPLKAKWNNAQLDGYPICYSKTKDGKRTIEYFEGGIDSKNLIYAEENKFWVTVENTSLVKGMVNQHQATLNLYFTVNLTEVKSEITTHRATFEVQNDVLEILERQGSVIRVNNVVTDIENVYKGYSYNKGDDLQPYHCFKIVLNAYNFRSDLVIC